jgi:hypothetical protein
LRAQAKQSMGQQGSVHCFVASAPRNDVKMQLRILAAPRTRVLLITSRPQIRGRRECRAPVAPAASRAMENKAHERSHYGHAGFTRHSPRNGFNAYIVLSPVTGLCCHRRLADTSAKLDTSVGASGPHDFAVRLHITRRLMLPTSIASRSQRS